MCWTFFNPSQLRPICIISNCLPAIRESMEQMLFGEKRWRETLTSLQWAHYGCVPAPSPNNWWCSWPASACFWHSVNQLGKQSQIDYPWHRNTEEALVSLVCDVAPWAILYWSYLSSDQMLSLSYELTPYIDSIVTIKPNIIVSVISRLACAI